MKDGNVNIKYILGILNSKLVSFYHFNTSANAFKETFPKVLIQDLKELPMPEVDNNKKNEIVKCVENLLVLHLEKSVSKLQSTIAQIENKLEYFENRINQLVYELYELNPEEIKIIEERN